MAVVDFLPDEIVLNILERLPAKPLVRFRCVSKYWCCMLMDPYFMKLRAARKPTIILHVNRETFDFIDGNISTNNMSTDSIFKRCYPFEHPLPDDDYDYAWTRLIGSINGLVLILTIKAFILYNPFTGESRKLPDPPTPIIYKDEYGFGYSSDTPSHLKIVRLKLHSDIYEVYDFKRNTWSSRSLKKYGIKYIILHHSIGTFVNGYLYWIKSKNALTVCNVQNMVVSKLILPEASNFIENLGTINGCLCSLKMTTSSRFELWVRKEHVIDSPWEKMHSFTLHFDRGIFYHTLNILDDGKILVVDTFYKQLIIYDISKGSYETLNIISASQYFPLDCMSCIQYVETLVSPFFDVCCFSRLDGRKNKSRKISQCNVLTCFHWME